jgi:hypothetical protein
MGDASVFLPSRDEVCARYRVRTLDGVRLGADGVTHREGGVARALAWASVRRVLAAEVGEPQGVRTVVFDLVVGGSARGFEVLRFDAEPGEEAVATARVLARHLPPERLAASIKSLAHDDVVEDWYPDLESFEEAALAGLAGLAP